MAGLPFSDTSTRTGLIQDAEDVLNFPAAGISGNTALLQQFTRTMNTWYHKVVTMILDSQDSWDFDDSANTDYPIGTIPLTTARDVTLPASSKILKIKRVDVTYDGTTWFKAELIDSGMTSFGKGNDTNEDANFTNTKPYYDLVGSNGIWVYPAATAANVTSGASVRIEFYRDITEFTTADTTKTPGFDTPFHRIISLGAAYDFALIKNLPTQQGIMNLLLDYESRLKRYYGQKITDQQFRVSAAYVDYN